MQACKYRACLLSFIWVWALPAVAQQAFDLEPEAKAILTERCLSCHNPDLISSGLVLSTRKAAIKGGESGRPAFVAGRPDESLMIEKVLAGEMPLDNPLPVEERELLRKWVAAGATWRGTLVSAKSERPRAVPGWWSFQPLRDEKPPNPEGFPDAWSRSPLDRFIYAKLREKGIEPPSPADRRTLIRRATFDLLGLPPTPEEVESFLEDPREDAYEKLLDRLLASPHYGERWGRHWLDVARFGESQGFERDRIRDHAWRYRDYVIESFNQDKPYDRFITEQLGGDFLEPITREGIIATSFLVAGPFDEIGNDQQSVVMKARVREEELEDTISAVSQTFLGLTINCARCHDHKFDPIPQADYYRMKAVFQGVHHGDRSVLPPREAHQRQSRMAPLKQRIASYYSEIVAIEGAARERVLRKRWHTREEEAVPVPIARWNFDVDGKDYVGQLHVTLSEGAGIESGRLQLSTKAAVLRSPPLPSSLREKALEVWLSLADPEQRKARVMSIENSKERFFDGISFGDRQPKKWGSASELSYRTYALSAPDEEAKPGELIHVAVVYSADNQITIYRNGLKYDSYIPDPNGTKGLLQTFEAQHSAIVFGKGLVGEIDEARLYDRSLSPEEIASSFRAGAPSVPKDELLGAMTRNQLQRRLALLSVLGQAEDELKLHPPVPLAYAASPRQPGPTFVLARGAPMQPGEQVTAGGLSAVETLSPKFGLPADAPEGLRRLKLADWITNPDNPLTARVMVNRVWHYHFGRGIVATPNDFGFNGDRPSHPDLVNWLAAEFITQGWSVKKLHKLIMLSSTYRQSSRFDSKAAEVDPENQLLWRFSPRRLEGEAIRDAMLAVSGQLNPQVGGPSFRSFSVQIKDNPLYTLTDPVGPEQNRRTVYRMNVNSAKSPLLENLDCPDPSTKTPRRSVTTTPLQALSLMNNSFVLRQARHFAERLRRESGDDVSRRVNLAYRLALGRPPGPAEVSRASVLARDHGMQYFCWVLLNANEFMYLE